MHSINKKTFIFYLFLCLLLISKLIAIINATYIMDGIEKQSLFTAASIAHGVPPLPSFFQADEPRCGGGPFLLSTLAVPFIVLLGKSYFSLRLASLVILVIIYITTFKFCEKYFGVAAAVCASLLLIITPATITQYSIVAYGRHYHLNLFFMLSLYLFAKIKESGQTRYYVLLSLMCGLGVYFYPAFLVTAFCMGLMLLSESNIKKPSSFFQYSLIIIGIIIGGHFLSSGMPWYRNIYTVVFHNGAKDVALSGTLF